MCYAKKISSCSNANKFFFGLLFDLTGTPRSAKVPMFTICKVGMNAHDSLGNAYNRAHDRD